MDGRAHPGERTACGHWRVADGQTSAGAAADEEPTILDRLPVGVLLYRHNQLIYANRAFLDWTGYENIDALAQAGGLDALFSEPGARPAAGDRREIARDHHQPRRAIAGRRPAVRRSVGAANPCSRWC